MLRFVGLRPKLYSFNYELEAHFDCNDGVNEEVDSTEKIGLSAFDTKRWICDDDISTYAFGHWKTEL